MEFTVEHKPSYSWLRIALSSGDAVCAEAGAMVYRGTALEMTTRLNAGAGVGLWGKFLTLLTAIARKVLGKESIFINEFTGAGELVLAPALAGDIVHLTLDGNRRYLVQAGSYLAGSRGVNARLRWGGLKTLFGGEGLFLLQCDGKGDLFLNSYGGIMEIEVEGSYVVDSGHIVAFEDSLAFKTRSVGGLKSFLLSGEGFVCEFRGRGKLWIQTRNLGALVTWIAPMLSKN